MWFEDDQVRIPTVSPSSTFYLPSRIYLTRESSCLPDLSPLMRGNHRLRPPPLSASVPLSLHFLFVSFFALSIVHTLVTAHSFPNPRHHQPRSIASTSHWSESTKGPSGSLPTGLGFGEGSNGGVAEGDEDMQQVRAGMSEGNAELATQGVVNLAASNRTTSRVSSTSSSSSRLPTTSSRKEPSRSSSSQHSSANATSARPSSAISTSQSPTTSESRKSRSTASQTRRTSTRPSTSTKTTRSKSSSQPASRSSSTSGRSSSTDISTTSSKKTRSRPKPSTSTTRSTYVKHRSGSTARTSHDSSTSTRTTSTPRKTTSRQKSKSKATARPTSTAKTTSRVSSTRASQTRPKATLQPSPTSYGYAPRKGCTEPPPTFEGSAKGFANLCRVRYCDAKLRRNMIWSGLDGDVTREEIESALGMLMQLEPVWENGQGNIVSPRSTLPLAMAARLHCCYRLSARRRSDWARGVFGVSAVRSHGRCPCSRRCSAHCGQVSSMSSNIHLTYTATNPASCPVFSRCRTRTRRIL